MHVSFVILGSHDCWQEHMVKVPVPFSFEVFEPVKYFAYKPRPPIGVMRPDCQAEFVMYQRPLADNEVMTSTRVRRKRWKKCFLLSNSSSRDESIFIV